MVGGSDSPPKRRKDRFQSDPQHLTASVSPGREVVDTAFGALNSCGRTEEVYPPIRQDRRHLQKTPGSGESPPSAGGETVNTTTPNMADIPPNKNNLSKDFKLKVRSSLKMSSSLMEISKARFPLSTVF